MNTIEQLRKDKQLVEQRIASELLSLSEKYGCLSIDIDLRKFETKDEYGHRTSTAYNVKLEVKL